MANPQQENFYTNPAFCQKSEYGGRSPPKIRPGEVSPRQPPVGAQAKYEEQEFYEEVIVDVSGAVRQKKFVVVSSPPPQPEGRSGNYAHKHRYEYIEDEENARSNRYERERAQKQVHQVKSRYEYIPMQQAHEEARVLHRYAVIPDEENVDGGVYALVPVEELTNRSHQPPHHRYEYVQQPRIHHDQEIRKVLSPQPQRKVNPAATQKLHELLATPKKQPQRASLATPNKTTPPKLTRQNSRAQQKLNYALGTRQMVEKRHTAIVAPICSSPVQSVYSETTFSQKSESWMNLSASKPPPVQATLAVASVMMFLCGGVSCGLCFYMMAIISRQYFLDFGVVNAFACLLLGFMGFRARYSYLLPNRNYISGYIVLSFFSLLTCAGLLVLLFMRPKPGTPLADITSGAICGISALSLFLAAVGLISSCCCKQPPPDNRVQHCARGFTV